MNTINSLSDWMRHSACGVCTGTAKSMGSMWTGTKKGLGTTWDVLYRNPNSVAAETSAVVNVATGWTRDRLSKISNVRLLEGGIGLAVIGAGLKKRETLIRGLHPVVVQAREGVLTATSWSIGQLGKAPGAFANAAVTSYLVGKEVLYASAVPCVRFLEGSIGVVAVGLGIKAIGHSISHYRKTSLVKTAGEMLVGSGMTLAGLRIIGDAFQLNKPESDPSLGTTLTKIHDGISRLTATVDRTADGIRHFEYQRCEKIANAENRAACQQDVDTYFSHN